MNDQVTPRDLARLEAEVDSLERLWKSSVDDIKATIKAEISELKSEQLADLKLRQAAMEERLYRAERKQDRWETSAGTVHWIIRAMFAVLGLAAGFFGADHIRH